MISDCQVSVVILTYKPNLKKLIRTVKSVVSQKNVDLEIIVSDDGSENDYFSNLEAFFDSNDVRNYVFNKNKQNVGTVKNIISGISKANGKYVYLISTGDMLYDDYVIKDFFDFSEENNSKIVFGQHLCYYEDLKDVIISKNIFPSNTCVYNKSFKSYKTAFLLGDFLVGPTYFREKNNFCELLKDIEECSIYVEDTTTTIFALAKNVPIHYYPRKIVWYEKGFGISQGIGNGWGKKVEDDVINTLKKAIHEYPKDKIIRAGYYYRVSKNKKDVIKNIIKFPCISLQKFFNGVFNKIDEIFYSNEDMKNLLSKL